jgi:hypothetical protein
MILWAAVALAILLALIAASLLLLANRAEPFLRARIVAALEDRFHARVELDSFRISLAGGLEAEGSGLRIWPPAQVEGISVPGPVQTASAKPAAGKTGSEQEGAPQGRIFSPPQPLIRLAEFHFRAPLRYQPGKPFHIALVQLKGLEIHLPPKSHFSHAAAPSTVKSSLPFTFQVDAIECASASLILETDKPGKQPLDFAIARLRLTNIAASGPLAFAADLTNPRPNGTLHTAGSFGPWRTADPGESPIAGSYRLEHANLADFKEIAGFLNSTGSYQGALRNVEVQGETDTPDFRLTRFANALPLHTRFQAAVDATNGDTRLEAVDATLGRSHFTAQGTILRVPARDGSAASIGHDIALAVQVDRARIEDFLLMAGHTPDPMLTGPVALKATLHIPPGAAHVEQRIVLDGRFTLNQAHFTNPKIQSRIEELSLRGQGHPEQIKSTAPDAIASTMQGDFHMAGGVFNLPALDYEVPGAKIQLKGSYTVEGGALNFAGSARLQAPVSQMVGGKWGALLKPLNGLFRKNGAGAEVPIHISGTRENPEFGVEFAGKEFDFHTKANK